MSALETAVAVPPRSRLFMGLALTLLVIVALGFGPTFFFRSLSDTTDYATGARNLPLHLLLHGVALSAWFVLFAVQAGLAAAGRMARHRQLGVAGAVVAVAVIVTSVPVLAGVLPRAMTWMTATGASPERIEEGLREVSWTIVPGSLGLLKTMFAAMPHQVAGWIRRLVARSYQTMAPMITNMKSGVGTGAISWPRNRLGLKAGKTIACDANSIRRLCAAGRRR